MGTKAAFVGKSRYSLPVMRKRTVAKLVAQFRAAFGRFGEGRVRAEKPATGWLGGPDSNFDTHERCRLASQDPVGTARDPHVR